MEFLSSAHQLLRQLMETMISGLPIPTIEEVKKMKDDLESFQAFIREDAGTDESRSSRKGKKQLMIEEAFHLEDIIDEYMMMMMMMSEEQQPPVSVCAALLSCEINNFIKTTVLGRRINSNFNYFETRLREFKESTHSSDSSRENKDTRFQYHHLQQDKDPLLIKEAEIVGFDAPGAELIDLLLSESQELTAISIVGMGGMGKTTLAKKVFVSKEVTQHFVRAWITVSQTYTIEVLLRNILKEFYKQTKDPPLPPPTANFEMDLAGLIEELGKYLHQKRYVVFFDDVWENKFLEEIKSALPENMNGSRIFITTRSFDVAKHWKFFNVYSLKPLNFKDSSDLFYMKALRSDFKGGIPEPLQNISYEIVGKCMGLPLAIVVVGSALSGKPRTLSAWKRFSQNLHLQLDHNSSLHLITIMFTQAYIDLPSYLKPCLLYFAIYPPHYEIKSNRLVRQWIAEGFVRQESGKTLEEVAQQYLIWLIDRSLVQASSLSIDGKVKGCRVHDLIREMILKQVDDLRFCKFLSREKDLSISSGIFRRLSTETTCNDSMENTLTRESSILRSLLFFTEQELPEKLVMSIPSTHKLLKLLDFESARSCHVPENFGVLIHLKYLSFRNTDMLYLPKSIGNLQNLETLDLRQTGVNELPQEVSKLKKLRHLLGEKLSLINLKGDIGGMSSLQTLSEVWINENETDLITELEMLTKLRKLSLFDVRKEKGTAVCSSISKMPLLEKLCIHCTETNNNNHDIDLSFVPYPTKLRKLRLQARLSKLPVWIPELENLVELSLSYSHLTEDPLESLKSLPKLLVLNLAVESYEGKSLQFQGGFQKLKELSLRYLFDLEAITVDGEALPCLEKITFMNIPKLKEVPPRIYNLKKLQVPNSYFMSAEFDEKIAPLIKDKMSKKI